MIPDGFWQKVGSLPPGRRAKFYELLLHELTIVVRAIWSDETLSERSKLDLMKWTNEIVHRVGPRLTDIRINEGNGWVEEEFGRLINEYSERHAFLSSAVANAVASSWRLVDKDGGEQ